MTADKGEAKENDPKTPFERFAEFTRRIVAVPKSEVSKKAGVYQRRKKRRAKRG